MSEAGSETLEDEWQSISEIASTCNTILESLSREGEATRAQGRGAWMMFIPFRPAHSLSLSSIGQPISESEDSKEALKCDSE